MTHLAETPVTDTFKISSRASVVIRDVPAILNPATGEIESYSASTSRAIDVHLRHAQAHNLTEMQFDPALIPPPRPADPVAQELRRAMRERGLSGSEIARALGVRPPLVSRWLSPAYHGHSMETLRRIAEVLDMEVEVKFKPKAS